MNSFYIRRVKLKNFLQFRDAVINLNPRPGKSIAIIEGLNGSGKSNILRAIDWCLFDSGHWEKFLIVSMPLCNSKVFRALKTKACAEISVELTLETPEGELLISRSVKAGKNLAGRESLDKRSMRFSVRGATKEGLQEILSPGKYIAGLFKPDRGRLSFIDGDLLRNFRAAFKREEMRKALPEIMGAARDKVDRYLKRGGPDFTSCLSSSEAVIAGYGMLAYLRKKAGINSPLIIDCPFSYLPNAYGIELAAWLKDKFRDSQVILLMTFRPEPDEISLALEPQLSDRLEIRQSASWVSEIKKAAVRRRAGPLS